MYCSSIGNFDTVFPEFGAQFELRGKQEVVHVAIEADVTLTAETKHLDDCANQHAAFLLRGV